jgi:hypothetical protein
MKRNWWLSGMMAMVAVTVSGCSSVSETAEVQGWVLLNGTPLTGATVCLLPEESGGAASGKVRQAPLAATTDQNGIYRLPIGARPGTYRVVIRGFVEELSNDGMQAIDESSMDMTQLEMAASARDRSSLTNGRVGAAQSGKLLPPHYSSASETILMLTVPEDGVRNALFELRTAETETVQNSTPAIH